MTDDRYWQTAQTVCTPKQLRILELRERHGFSLRHTAHACDISIRTVRVQIESAHHKINLALKETA